MHLLLDIDWRIFDRVYMGDKVSDYIWFAGLVIGGLLLKRPMANLVTRCSTLLAARFQYIKYRLKIRSMLFKPVERLITTIVFYAAYHQIDNFFDHFGIKHFIGIKEKINLRLSDVLDHVFLFLFIVYFTQLVGRFLDFSYYIKMGRAQATKNYSRIQMLPLIKEIAKLLLWTLSIFWILGEVMHVNIPALITGLGIGGVAIALAGKETVENFFAAFTILSDKPFKVGETIKLGEIEGVVERIGFRSTRLRHIDGSAYIVPNQNLVSQSIINLSARDNRVMKVIANIKYGISHEKLVALMEQIKDELLKMQPVKEPIDIVMESFDKETFQMSISYNLPHPLPAEAKLLAIKREVNMKVFEVISSQTTMGTPVGTS